MSVQDVVATANVFIGLNDGDAEECLRKVLREGPMLVGLQEWGDQRRHVLDKLEATTMMRWTRPSIGGSPVLWMDGRYSLLSCRGRVIARAGFVGGLPGRKSHLDDSVATVAIFEDEEAGGETVLVNAHLTAEVQKGIGYRRDRAHRRRVNRHRREVRNLKRIVRRHLRKNRRVYVTADTNYAGLELAPLISCWEKRNGHTLGNRAVDIVWGIEPARDVITVTTKSDHRHVVATYPRSKG